MTVENVTYAIGSVCEKINGIFGDPITCRAYLDAGPEDAKELNLMFWD